MTVVWSGVEEEKLWTRKKQGDEDMWRPRTRREQSGRTGRQKQDEVEEHERDDDNRETTQLKPCHSATPAQHNHNTTIFMFRHHCQICWVPAERDNHLSVESFIIYTYVDILLSGYVWRCESTCLSLCLSCH